MFENLKVFVHKFNANTEAKSAFCSFLMRFRCENSTYLTEDDGGNAGWDWTDEDGQYDDYEKSRTRDPHLYVYKVDGLDTQKLVEGRWVFRRGTNRSCFSFAKKIARQRTLREAITASPNF